ncbi:MAG: hypothetical protein KIT58_02920 [Planctomycetota bacterium]|nr:hypothetical protein [Planctomycetota bacterium]
MPDYDELVTAVFQVKHGAGNSIFATVRGLLTRDTNRIGNILSTWGPRSSSSSTSPRRSATTRARVIDILDVAGPRQGNEDLPGQLRPVQDLATILTQAAAARRRPAGSLGSRSSWPRASAGRRGRGDRDRRRRAPNQLIAAAFPHRPAADRERDPRARRAARAASTSTSVQGR